MNMHNWFIILLQIVQFYLDKQKFTIKTFSAIPIEQFPHWEAELRKIYQYQHEHIINFFGIKCKSSGSAKINLQIFQKYYDYNLQTILNELPRKNSQNQINLNQKVQIIYELLLGLNYLHNPLQLANKLEQQFHGVLKPSNILLDNQFHAYISDFPQAKLYQNLLNSTNKSLYAAPEQTGELKNATVCQSSDIWSLGLIAYKLLFPNFNIKQVQKTKDQNFEDKESGYQNLLKLINLMMKYKMEERQPVLNYLNYIQQIYDNKVGQSKHIQ